MAWSPYIVLLLWAPVLVWAQNYRVDYHCDFESGDCGLRNVSFNGAYFRHRLVTLGTRSTRCLVMDDLPAFSNWTFGVTRSAMVSTPVVFPVYGPLTISLDYYMPKGQCVDFLEMRQQYGNVSRSLRRVNVPSDWSTMSAIITNPGQPVKLVVEARLQPHCQDYASCRCANMVAVDNLRIVSDGTGPTSPQTFPPTYPPHIGPTRPMGLPHNFYQWWGYYHHWIKKIRKTWPDCRTYYPCNRTINAPCPPYTDVVDPRGCPTEPPIGLVPGGLCPNCPRDPVEAQRVNCPPSETCPPIRRCPAIEPCPYPPISKPGHNLTPWDPFATRNQLNSPQN